MLLDFRISQRELKVYYFLRFRYPPPERNLAKRIERADTFAQQLPKMELTNLAKRIERLGVFPFYPHPSYFTYVGISQRELKVLGYAKSSTTESFENLAKRIERTQP